MSEAVPPGVVPRRVEGFSVDVTEQQAATPSGQRVSLPFSVTTEGSRFCCVHAEEKSVHRGMHHNARTTAALQHNVVA
ncbi:unnamed protein product [Lota lota]